MSGLNICSISFRGWSRFLLASLLTAMFVACIFPANAQSQTFQSFQRATHRLQIRRYHPPGTNIKPVTPDCSNPKLSYFDGPVISNVQVIPVFWNGNVNAQVIQNLPQFYADATQSTWFDMLLEYSSVNGASGTNQSIGWGTASAGVTIVPSVCPASVTGTCKLTDAQLQAELSAQIGKGVLPPPQNDPNGYDTTLYMVHFPPNISLNYYGLNSCVDFCAYHDTASYGALAEPMPYGAIMDTYSGACANGCADDSTALQDQTDVSSHELAESVTDTDIGFDTQSDYAYPGAWGDNNNECGEVADICDSNSPGDTITVSGRNWVVQELWSNQQGKCTSDTPLAPSFQVSLPTTANAGTSFSFTVTAENPAGNKGADNGYIGTVHFTSSDPHATLPADFSFTPTNQGTATFSATLLAGGSQSVTATTTVGTATAGTDSISINASPGIYSPVNGSSLSSSSATFLWGAYSGATAYWLDVGAEQGGHEYYSSGSLVASTSSQTVSSLPVNGKTVYVTWYYQLNGTWTPTYYSYTAFGSSSTAAMMTSPAANSILTGSSVTFTWSAATDAPQAYWLDAGSTAGAHDIYSSGSKPTTTLSLPVSGIPTNGGTLYVTLYTETGGVWVSNAYTYAEYSLAAAAATMTTPTPGSTLTGSSVMFNWTAGSGASGYWIDAGSTAGAHDLYSSGNLGNGTTLTVSGLPTDGVMIYVTLYSLIGSTWSGNAYTYTAFNATGGLATMISPANNSVLSGNAVTFTWTSDNNASGYWVDVSAVGPGGNDLDSSGNLGTVTTETIYNLPANGGTIYVTLYSLVGGQWLNNRYTYVSGP